MMDRSSTYNALKQLIELGIVSTLYEKKRTIFVPADPKKIIDYFKEKEEIASKITPDLRAQYSTSEKKSVMLFQGYKGLKTLFEDIIDSTKDEYYVLGSEGNFRKQMPHYAVSFARRHDEKKIKTKVLVREGRTNLKSWKYSEYKKIPINVVSPATINIYAGKVAIFLWGDKPEAILIENPRVYETMKGYFQFMWKYAKK